MTSVRIKYALLGAALAVLVAPSPGSAEDLKVGVVDLEQALSSTEEGKAAREEMGRKQREAESTVQPLVDRFNTMKEEIKSKKFVLSDESLFQKQLDLAELQNQIQTKLKELEGQLKVHEERLYGPLRAVPGQRHAVHYLRLGCSPCMFVHDNKVLSCWFSKARCMTGIGSRDVLASVEKLLSAARV